MPEMGANLTRNGRCTMPETATDATETETTETETTTETATADKSEKDETDWKAEAEKAKAEADKWKNLSRKNENDLKTERDKAKTAGMSADEKATTEAEAKGRKSAAVEYGKKLALAEFKAACAVKQYDPTEILDDIDVTKYVDENGEVDTAAITKAAGRFAKLAPAKDKAAGKSGGDFSGGTGAGQAITEAQLATMTKPEIAKAYAEGKLKHLM